MMIKSMLKAIKKFLPNSDPKISDEVNLVRGKLSILKSAMSKVQNIDPSLDAGAVVGAFYRRALASRVTSLGPITREDYHHVMIRIACALHLTCNRAAVPFNAQVLAQAVKELNHEFAATPFARDAVSLYAKQVGAIKAGQPNPYAGLHPNFRRIDGDLTQADEVIVDRFIDKGDLAMKNDLGRELEEQLWRNRERLVQAHKQAGFVPCGSGRTI